MFLGDIVIFDNTKIGIFVGDDVVLYPNKDVLKKVSFKKIESKINMIRRFKNMDVEDYTIIFNELMKYKNDWFRQIFKPKKLSYSGVTFIAYLLNLIHLLIKFDFKQVTLEDIKFSIKLYTIIEKG